MKAFCLSYDNKKYEAINDFAFNSKPSCSNSPLLNELRFEINEDDPWHFTQAVERIKEQITEGNIYQANLCRKYTIQPSRELVTQELQMLAKELYAKLQRSNPAPYAAHMSTEDYEIISCSPELFLRIEKNGAGDFKLSTSPIKGTVKSGNEQELLLSEKEKAEHIMIVDLMRNDLGKICQTGSIAVEEQLAIHRFEALSHLISTISGILNPDFIEEGEINLDKTFAAITPGGSISGAPKTKAMQIISELEANPRELYTGCMGYYDVARGYGEFSILIRTVVINKTTGEISLGVGAGITAHSKAEDELEETRLKAKKILEVFRTN